MGKYPSETQYDRAIQHPEKCFNNSQLKLATVATSPIGVPLVWAGNFAYTYKLIEQNNDAWAVRCFHKAVFDRYTRYKAISAYLKECPHPCLRKIDYLEDEILVEGRRYPVTKMPWIAGETLGVYLDRCYHDGATLTAIADNFRNLTDQLLELKIVHGDLAHDNIIVHNNQLVLVDYDGMWVPGLAGMLSAEIGHPNFQHPKRTNTDFNLSIDRFSTIVIYLALQALIEKPDLWERYSPKGKGELQVEGILFQQKDFQNPYASQLLVELEHISTLSRPVAAFRKICQDSFKNVPKLNEFIATVPSTQRKSFVPRPHPLETNLGPIPPVQQPQNESKTQANIRPSSASDTSIRVTPRVTSTYIKPSTPSTITPAPKSTGLRQETAEVVVLLLGFLLAVGINFEGKLPLAVLIISLIICPILGFASSRLFQARRMLYGSLYFLGCHGVTWLLYSLGYSQLAFVFLYFNFWSSLLLAIVNLSAKLFRNIAL